MLVMFALVQSGCSGNDNEEDTLLAHVKWTQDVSSIDMDDFGMQESEIIQNETFRLLQGEGAIHWVSGGVEYSKNINVGSNKIVDADTDIECEQEGENEGENEGCVFSFEFSGDSLSITNR